jgi:hypothetical protein
MAFRMTRPTIQGTEYHKASVLKAKAETVAQTRTAADPTLVAAGSELGKSNISKAIDFTIKPTEIKIPEGDSGKKKPREKDGGKKKPREKEKQTDNAFNEVNKDGNVLSKSGKVIGKGVVNGVGVLIGAGGQILNAAGDILEGTVNAAGEVVDLGGNVIGGVLGGVDKVLKGIDQKIKDAGNKYKVRQAEKFEDRFNKAMIGGQTEEEYYSGMMPNTNTKKSDYISPEVEDGEKIAMEIAEKNRKLSRKSTITAEPAVVTGFGERGIANYSSAQQKELEEKGVFNEEAGRIVLPSEVGPNGEFISKAEEMVEMAKEIIVVPPSNSKTEQTTTTSQTTQNVTNTKPKLSDFKDGKNAFGGHVSKNQAYNEAMKKWRRENPNPIQMRNDAIYKNAIKDGIVQKNMIKSGYKPLD